ncbi:MAG: hypothetical protein ABIJ42_07850 [Acidobacteriota bacterium]
MINRINSRKAELSETLKGLVSIANIIIIISGIIALTGLRGMILS